MRLHELLEIRDIWKFSKRNIFYVIVGLYLLSIFYYMREYSLWTPVWEYMYNHSMSVIFAPIYEEILFRWIILVWLVKVFSKHREVIIWWGILFGIWHFKNFPFMSLWENLYQVFYTVFLWWFLTWIALKYNTVWLWVIIHYINNILLHPLSWATVAFLSRTL